MIIITILILMIIIIIMIMIIITIIMIIMIIIVIIIVGQFVDKIIIIYRIYLCRNRNILSPCNPELVDLLDS